MHDQRSKSGPKMSNDLANTPAAELISERKKPRKHGIAAYRKNPFWQPTEVKIGTRKITIAGGMLVEPNTGESIHAGGITRVELVDEDKFIKVFTQNLKVFFDLSKSAQTVLQCFIAQVQKQPNTDGIWLPWFEIEDYTKANDIKISRATFQRAMHEMLTKGFIAESENQNFYWINPHLFFNGDRVRFVQEFHRMSRTKQQRQALNTTKP